jgi:hypothetical protein
MFSLFTPVKGLEAALAYDAGLVALPPFCIEERVFLTLVGFAWVALVCARAS